MCVKYTGVPVGGYYVDTAGKNASRVAEYITNQLKEDELGNRLSRYRSNSLQKRSSEVMLRTLLYLLDVTNKLSLF